MKSKGCLMEHGDNRVYARSGCNITGEFENVDLEDRGIFKGRICDISEGGLRLCTRLHPFSFRKNREKYVRFRMLGCSPAEVKIQQVWTRWVFSKFRFETGVRFLDLGLEARWAIKEWVSKHPQTA